MPRRSKPRATAGKPRTPSEILDDGRLIDAAVRRAVRQELKLNAMLAKLPPALRRRLREP